MNSLQLVGIHKSFGETRALDGVSFEVAKGKIVAVLGPSGCGKSTLLSVIAGLETPDQGALYWNGVDLAGVPTHQRGFGLMFQDYALFPHMDAFDNVTFGLRMGGMHPKDIRKAGAEALSLVGLPGYGDRDVNTLSGGEQQRIALARSLAPQPQLLMLDEPLGSLDRALRERLLVDLQGILHRLKQTALYVTHDQDEAFAISDRVVLMDRGRVVQTGTPQEIYSQPASPFVAQFLGLDNLFAGEASMAGGQTSVTTPIGTFQLPGQTYGPVTVLIRPDTASLDGEKPFHLVGTLVERSFRGSWYQARIHVKGEKLTFEFPGTAQLPAVGELVYVGFDPATTVHIFSGR